MNTKVCEHCLEELTEVNGVWTSPAECESESGHNPAPEEMECEGCGEDIAWDYSEKYCQRCIDEADQIRRDQEWDYWHA